MSRVPGGPTLRAVRPIMCLVTESAGGYRPGTCNIGAFEIARRRRLGYVSLAAAAVLAAALVALDLPRDARWLLVLPLGGAFTGLLQARFRFCAWFGLAGLRNFGADNDCSRVPDPVDRLADARRALWLLTAAGGLAVVVTGAFVALPV